jgi:putative transposase
MTPPEKRGQIYFLLVSSLKRKFCGVTIATSGISYPRPRMEASKLPRRARIAFSGYPHHIVQRGHRRDAVFFSDSDRFDYLATLQECRLELSIALYAYCLMTNHVHLVVNPREDPRRLSLLMKRLAGRHSRRLNRLHGWSGSLWEGRFHCSPIETDRYLLACGRYVDQNPLRARLVRKPDDFEWSSYRARAGLVECDWLDADPALADLAPTPERRFEFYRSFVGSPATEQELRLIRGALQRNQLTGSQCFSEAISNEFGIEVSAKLQGRPRKNSRG